MSYQNDEIFQNLPNGEGDIGLDESMVMSIAFGRKNVFNGVKIVSLPKVIRHLPMAQIYDVYEKDCKHRLRASLSKSNFKSIGD
ncbi:hypothetical protein SARC_00858 [Sphaeroforma arctica JP610]|uniref:Uncharacterized protein n=1 Tax=Sphaeroforma arctica JP610 TaxID=667725 RepID=A0A0L0GDB9_9EUKA|nr:hypothetical protein SARC_00858 [Sphaeroforma arctica JP610]KNC87005.1 hypothetical protein SARC_00858 [Sphaeroforma arctica JP610]|eukprot:XP_014160907.1 hypothetical protein SARC_00858 [Sphaeroforma arctica JP610]